MKVIYIIELVILLASCDLGYGKFAPVNKKECPPGPVPQECPFPDHELSTFFPHTNDCHWFFHCSNGVPYCKECPSNLHWNKDLETCDWPEHAGCKSSPATEDPPTYPPTDPPTDLPTDPPTEAPATDPPTNPPAGTPSPSPECPPGRVPTCPNPDPEFSEFSAHENDCHWFFHCSNGVAYCKECPPGLHWNSRLDTCDWPGQAGCESGGNPTDPSTDPSSVRPTDPPIVSTDPPTEPPTDPPTEAPTTDPPTDPPTEASEPPTEAPETPTEAPPAPSECPPGKIPTCPNPDPAYSVFFPHENDCNWFFHCSNGVAYCKQCPAGLHWNPDLDTCDWPEHAGCKPAAPSECPPGKVPTCPNPDPAYSVFFPHENDCHWFFHCSKGVAYCKECPAGLHFNAQFQTCDYPYRAGCE